MEIHVTTKCTLSDARVAQAQRIVTGRCIKTRQAHAALLSQLPLRVLRQLHQRAHHGSRRPAVAVAF